LTNNFSLNGWLLKRGFLLSAAVTLLGFIVAIGISWTRNDERIESTLGAQAKQFAPTSRQDLEDAYHRAWIALRENFADQDKLSDWQGWETRYRGKIRTERQLVLAIEDMMSTLGDKRTTVITAGQLLAFEQAKAGKVVGIGVGLNEYKVQNVFPNSPAAKAGIAKGDMILAVDGTQVGGLSTSQMIDLIRGAENTSVVLTVNHENKVRDVMVTRTLIRQDPAVRSIPWVPVPSIRVDNLRADSVVAEIDKNLKPDGPMLLDLRGLSGGSGMTAAQVAALFLTEGTITSATQRKDGVDYKVTYAIKDGKLVQSTQRIGGTTVDTIVETPVGRYAGKLVILVDDRTTGAAEVITAALQDNKRATVVGIKTRGKGTGQVTVPLTKKYVMRVTNAKYFSPSGNPIDGKGVQPDLPIDPKDRGSLFHQAMTATLAQK
jgi:carboxyl-terminal processing protease